RYLPAAPLVFDAPPPTEIYPLSLHDALPISSGQLGRQVPAPVRESDAVEKGGGALAGGARRVTGEQRGQLHVLSGGQFVHQVERSEEHTSELQSRENLVCRLLLEKKKEHRIG